MEKIKFTKEYVLQKTQEVVHHYFERRPEEVISTLADDFVWIGAFDFQWGQNKEEFIALSHSEFQSPEIHILSEEYNLLRKNSNMWIVYGRYYNLVLFPDGTYWEAYNRGTFIWEKRGLDLVLIHSHTSTAQSLEREVKFDVQPPSENNFFEYMQKIEKKDGNKVSFRDTDGNYHILHSYEIIYLKADGKHTDLHTRSGVIHLVGLISVNMKDLPEHFVMTQKSYVVNSFYINSVRRYQADLKNGESVPISKYRYMELKETLLRLGI